MALKFLNKKGWHTGSLRNIENVWKAEQKHEAEQRKLEELRKQIHEERERAEFRQLQEQAGLISGQERLEFLYDSGLAVGKSSGFKALESLPKTQPEEAAASSSASGQPQSVAPGALFEEKPQSANDAWRKLTSDPLLLIRKREQEALARIKNNPIQMAMIRKSVEVKKTKDKDDKKHKKKHHRKKSKHRSKASSDDDSEDAALAVEKQRDSRHYSSKSDKRSSKRTYPSDDESSEGDTRRKKYFEEKDGRSSGSKFDNHSSKRSHASDDEYSEGDARKKYLDEKDRKPSGSKSDKHSSKRSHASYDDFDDGDARKKYFDERDRKLSGSPNRRRESFDDQSKNKKHYYDPQQTDHSSERQLGSRHDKKSYSTTSDKPPRHDSNSRHRNPVRLSEDERADKLKEMDKDKPPRHEPNNRRRNPAKLTDEERAAKLKEMEMDAERHEEQRWKRIKKAADADAQEAVLDQASSGRNFLDAAQKSVYGAEKGGSSTIEESVRRRTHYSQRRSDSESNAFRRA